MSPRLIGATLAFVVGFPLLSLAAPMYDFSSLAPGGVAVDLGTGTTSISGGPGTISISAFYLNGSTWTATNLIARNEGTDERGLGVCSPTEDGASGNCKIGSTGGGDYNELSHKVNDEAILLEKPAGTQWADLFVSSLDDNNVGGNELGTLFWGSTSDIGTLLGGTGFSFDHLTSLSGANEGSVFGLGFGLFNKDAQYLLFIPGGSKGTDNDYLVWGAALSQPKTPPDTGVPEPMTLLLVGSGLPGLAYWRRRRSGR